MADEKHEMGSADSENLMAKFFIGTSEKTVDESPYVPDSFEKPYNTDDLYKKVGDYSIYEDMFNDDQCNIALQMKYDLVLGGGFDIVAGEDGHEDIVKDIEEALTEDSETYFLDQCQEILTGYKYGFSLSEKIFQRRPDGTLTWRTFKTRHPATWEIYTDKHSNIKKYLQLTSEGDSEINKNSLLHYINKPEFGNPYGRSDLRAAYTAWFVKRQIFKYYAIFLEKNASPIPVAKYKAQHSGLKDKLLTILKGFQQKSAVVVPSEVDLEFLQSNPGSVGEAYIKGINLCNTFIGRSMFIPDLIGFSGGETSGGSFALGETQTDMFFKHIKRRRESLERLINKHVVWPIVVTNFGFIPNYPKFKLRPAKEEDAKEFARIWLEGVKARAWETTEEEINHFRKALGYPESDVSFLKEEAEEDEEGEEGKEGEEEAPKDGEDEIKDGEDENDKEAEEKVEEEEKKEFKSSNEIDRRTDFKAAGRAMDSAIDNIVKGSKPLVAEMVQDVIDQIGKKKIVEKKRISLVNDLKFRNLKKINQLIRKSFRDLHSNGKLQAKDEIFVKNFASSMPIPSEEFLKVLEDESFEAIGDWKFNQMKKIKPQLSAAIKDGSPLSSVIPLIEEDMNNGLNVSIERYARTKTVEVLNKGRLEFFDSIDIVIAYKYSALMDGRTTDICSGLNGKIFKKGLQPIPPMHFNCRSILIPLTKFDDFSETTEIKRGGKTFSPDGFIDEFKGKGFPKQ